MATIQRSSTRSIEICHSPDEGGWYVQQEERWGQRPRLHRFRTSKKIYKTHADAEKAYLYGDVKWTKWN
jgi:hypothetical protein